MTTRITVTTGDGGLLERNAQQQAANRQGTLVKGQAEQAAATGAEQQRQRRIAAGLDPATGRPLPSAGSTSRLTRIDQDPAAFRKDQAASLLLYPSSRPSFFTTIFSNPIGSGPYSTWTAYMPVYLNRRPANTVYSIDFRDPGDSAGIIMNPLSYNSAGGPYNNPYITSQGAESYRGSLSFQAPALSPDAFSLSEWQQYGTTGTLNVSPPFMPTGFPNKFNSTHTLEVDILHSSSFSNSTEIAVATYLLPSDNDSNFGPGIPYFASNGTSYTVRATYGEVGSVRQLLYNGTAINSTGRQDVSGSNNNLSILPANQWVRYAMTINGPSVKVYQNTALIGAFNHPSVDGFTNQPPAQAGYTWVTVVSILVTESGTRGERCSISAARYTQKHVEGDYVPQDLLTTRL